MKHFISSMNWLILASGLCSVILGIAMLFLPVHSLSVFAILLGILIVLAGVSQLLNVLKTPDAQRSGWMIMEGVITLLIGGWMIFGNGIRIFWSVLPFVFAILMMINGIIRIDSAYTNKAKGIGKWKSTMGFGIAEYILGLVLVFSPLLSAQLGTIILALLLILYGVSNIATAFHAEQISSFFRSIIQRISPVNAHIM